MLKTNSKQARQNIREYIMKNANFADRSLEKEPIKRRVIRAALARCNAASRSQARRYGAKLLEVVNSKKCCAGNRIMIQWKVRMEIVILRRNGK